MAEVCGCGREIKPPGPSIVTAGGWCAPSESLQLTEVTPMCSDCNVRMLMMMTIGIDPGRDGENLKVKRGGITYG